MTDHAIIEELIQATELKTKKKEKRQTFLGRLVKASTELGDEEWNEVSDEAQEWVNAGIEAINEKNDIPEPEDAPDEDDSDDDEAEDANEEEDDSDDDEEEDEEDEEDTSDDDEEEDEEDDSDDDEEEEPPTKAAKKTSKKAAPAEKSKRGGSLCLRRIFIQDPLLTLEEVLVKVEEEGFTIAKSTASIVYYETRAVLRVMNDLGLFDLPEKPAKKKAAKKPEPEEKPAKAAKKTTAKAAKKTSKKKSKK